jgi:hypothetical protein
VQEEEEGNWVSEVNQQVSSQVVDRQLDDDNLETDDEPMGVVSENAGEDTETTVPNQNEAPRVPAQELVEPAIDIEMHDMNQHDMDTHDIGRYVGHGRSMSGVEPERERESLSCP